MEKVQKDTYECLDKLGIVYECYEHEAVYTIAQAAEIDEKVGFPISKNLFLSSRHQTEFFLLFMDGSKKFNTGRVSKQLGVPRMTFAGDEEMLAFLNIRPGAVSPLGLLFDTEKRVKFLIDKDILAQEKVSMHPCVNTATVVIKTTDLLDVILPSCGHGDYQAVTID